MVATRLHRRWIGIEREPRYVSLAASRIEQTEAVPYDPHYFDTPDRRKQPRLPFGRLLANDLLRPGDRLYYQGDRSVAALVMADGALEYNGRRGSIHQVARQICHAPCNGWQPGITWTKPMVPCTPSTGCARRIACRMKISLPKQIPIDHL